MNTMLRLALPATAITLVVFSGIVHGLWTDRWNEAPEPFAAAAKLEQVAMTLGDWEGQALVLESRSADGVAGYLYRRYVNRNGGKVVSVFLVCGRPGPVSIHSPEACYGASGYEIDNAEVFTLPSSIDGVAGEFRTARFEKTTNSGQKFLRIFWSWNATGPWSVPVEPRSLFAHHPVLYKLYLVREISEPDGPLEQDPCVELMRYLLPELQRAVIGSS
jgi:hypothetical protein